MNANIRVCAVIVTYNSIGELSVCLEGLIRQLGVDLRIVVVDNNSEPEKLSNLLEEFQEWFPNGVVADIDSLDVPDLRDATAFFIRNSRNAGYSSGNNIGARLAVHCGCHAVLIVNPDMRIRDGNYVKALLDGMQSDPSCLVAASRIVGLDGTNQNGLREAGFWEELLWVRQLGPRFLHPKPFVTPPKNTKPFEVEKVSGCCLMIRTSFLEDIGFLDENVFLYCEEPILAAQVRTKGGRLLVFPQVEAVHAHIAGKKDNSSRRMLNFIRSRRYYLREYSGYGPVRRALLQGSYGLLYGLHALKAKLSSKRSTAPK